MSRSAKVTIGGQERSIYDFSGRKALTAMRIVRSISEAWPRIVQGQAEFRRRYQEENHVLLERSQAIYQLDPDRLEKLTDADWEKSGNKIRLDMSPTNEEVWASVFPMIFDEAEEQAMQLVGLCLVTNEEVRDAARNGKQAVIELLDKKAETVLDDASATEIVEVLVVAAELIHDEFQEKLASMGDRVGKLRGLVGLRKDSPGQTSEKDETSSKTSSSSDSPEPSSGTRSEPSTATPSTGSLPSLAS